jgi:hypothetical protein
MFTAAPLRAPASIIGPERILFSVDYTVEREQPGRAFLDALPISPANKSQSQPPQRRTAPQDRRRLANCASHRESGVCLAA